MNHLLRFILLSALLLSACSEKADNPKSQNSGAKHPDETQSIGVEQHEELNALIEKLEHEIESSMQIIDDLQAAVVMEEAKLQDDPNYDQSFLQETLADQEREREDINKAQKQLKNLKP